ncbi:MULTISPECIES: SCP2 sterol-binding domain-containing protein [Bacillaceae]|uniref:SCP2 sterol-binding domain-containing protein n=1 Tax=Evansella alkalicola TaxID=745819 RepID=A0ABS6JWY8_9BACI|nr:MULTISPECIES: SCP2 sterol-binding domain-containing protein [Bacillaceae]MBU9722905.1 SCP2 sterol-binding domain-containing protein [Bacillus alkalicola]
MSVKDMFQDLLDKMKEDPSHLGDMNVIYQFNLSGTDVVYQLKIENKEVDFVKEEKYDPKITIEMNEENFKKLVEGNLNPTMAYMSGKLKVRGDLSLALKLHSLLKKYQ